MVAPITTVMSAGFNTYHNEQINNFIFYSKVKTFKNIFRMSENAFKLQKFVYLLIASIINKAKLELIKVKSYLKTDLCLRLAPSLIRQTFKKK